MHAGVFMLCINCCYGMFCIPYAVLLIVVNVVTVVNVIIYVPVPYLFIYC